MAIKQSPTKWIKDDFRVVLNGLARAGLVSGAPGAFLCLFGTILISPWAALGAVLGTVFFALLGPLFQASKIEWQKGLGSFDGAILGIFWGGTLSTLEAPVLLFPVAILTCLFLQRPVWAFFHFVSLPPLATSSLITVWVCDQIFITLGHDFWVTVDAPPLGDIGVIFSLILFFLAAVLQSIRGALVTFLCAFMCAIISGWYWQAPNGIGPVELWAFTVMPAIYAVSGVYLPFNRNGVLAGILAAGIAVIIWIIWMETSFNNILPPLLAPFSIGVWIALFIAIRNNRKIVLDFSTISAARLLRNNKSKSGKTIAITGAGISTASGIPDYTGTGWLDLHVPVRDYSYRKFCISERCRRLTWKSCAFFKNIVSQAIPNEGHKALADIQRKGYLGEVITQNVDGFHEAAQTNTVLPIHGIIKKTHCLSCDWEGDWPDHDRWMFADITCNDCGGFIKPSVIALGEDIPPLIWNKALNAAKDASLVLAIGSRLSITSAVTLITEARRNGAKIIFINIGDVNIPVYPNDIAIFLPAEKTLPALLVHLR